MDRARDAGAARPRRLRTHQSRRCRGTLTPQGTRLSRAGGVVLLLMAAVACNKFGPADLSRVIALDVSAPDSLEEYDTLKPHARVLDGHGDSVAATIVWATADTTPILTVLDSLTGWTVVNRTGQTGRLVARSDRLVSNPLSIRTLAAADTLFTTLVSTVDTVTLSADSVSDSLTVEVADTIKSSSGGDSLTVALAGRPVVYAITYPATSGLVTLVTDSTHGLVTTDTVATGASGIAFVQVRLLGAPVPDSVVVAAIARRAVGDTVPGSPVTFVVRFRP